MATARNAAKTYFEAHPPRLGIDVAPMARESFENARRSKNHVAGQAAREGIIMSGQELESGNQRDDGYPSSWPDVKERLQAAYRQLGAFNRMMAAGDFPQEDYGFRAQQAVENAMKAWMSAADIGYGRVHDLADLARLTLEVRPESPPVGVSGYTPGHLTLRSEVRPYWANGPTRGDCRKRTGCTWT